MAAMLASAPTFTSGLVARVSLSPASAQSRVSCPALAFKSVRRTQICASSAPRNGPASEESQDALVKTAAASMFALMANVGSAAAVQEIATVADADNRPLLLLLLLAPAVGWVLFNILQPALRQLDNMRGVKGLAMTLGLGAAASAMIVPQADAAQEITQLAADARPLILLFILAPAVGWVLFNILQPALRQLEQMQKKK
eukprot:TRINITY_DN29608_c0_g1_i1.p1 TRINITY_DN29608_c0_g1~~TRINITY_DN29608_c0_g1_i1.p1  ORF type:complete len:200 (+),score=40.35 TRINITY_DN29608_c0_g1_i1:298-897(+)